jgi:AhpD family alkylhydroperoxidase
MASLDAVTTELVGIAAAVAGHCQPCLEYHLAEAVSRSGDKHMRDFARKTMRLPAAARPE